MGENEPFRLLSYSKIQLQLTSNKTQNYETNKNVFFQNLKF